MVGGGGVGYGVKNLQRMGYSKKQGQLICNGN